MRRALAYVMACLTTRGRCLIGAGTALLLVGAVLGERALVQLAVFVLALLFLPPRPLTLAAGFLVFRLLDILKPFPAGRLESLPGGAGIMADDLAAAVYTNLLVRALAWAVLGSQGLAT